MLTRTERRAVRSLRAELQRLQKLYGPDLKQKKGEEFDRLLAEYFGERDIVDAQLASIESDDLIRRAKRWSVDIPAGAWERGPTGELYLKDETRAAIGRAVKNERRTEVKWWVDILIPVLSLLIALVAVIGGR